MLSPWRSALTPTPRSNPGVAKWRVVGHNDVLAEFYTRSIAGYPFHRRLPVPPPVSSVGQFVRWSVGRQVGMSVRVLRPALAGARIAQLEEPAGLDAADVDRLGAVIVHDEETAIVGNGEVVERLPGRDLEGSVLSQDESINARTGE